jgi:hypothetical protein
MMGTKLLLLLLCHLPLHVLLILIPLSFVLLLHPRDHFTLLRVATFEFQFSYIYSSREPPGRRVGNRYTGQGEKGATKEKAANFYFISSGMSCFVIHGQAFISSLMHAWRLCPFGDTSSRKQTC